MLNVSQIAISHPSVNLELAIIWCNTHHVGVPFGNSHIVTMHNKSKATKNTVNTLTHCFYDCFELSQTNNEVYVIQKTNRLR